MPKRPNRHQRSLPSGQSGGTLGFTGAGGANFAYQAIGTASCLSGFDFEFSIGSYTGHAETRQSDLVIGVYEQMGAFTPADGTDVVGAGGIALLDQVSISSGPVDETIIPER